MKDVLRKNLATREEKCCKSNTDHQLHQPRSIASAKEEQHNVMNKQAQEDHKNEREEVV